MSALYENSIIRAVNETDNENNKQSDLQSVQKYYGKVLSTTEDLKTNACCTSSSPPEYLKECIANIDADVTSKYYGCGLVIPDCLHGKSVLDLGCGSGRDCYILSQLVGEHGSVTGIDMTEEQLEIAKRNEEIHAIKFGYAKKNTKFIRAYLEELDFLPANSFDVIVSNCVVNLSPKKRSVLQQAYRLLKEGGEFYFSDVYSDRRVPKDLVNDEELWGECISGALYYNDFDRLAKECGFKDPRLVTDSVITVDNKELEKQINGRVKFFSATYRLFKLPNLEPDCEDYGQSVIYKGSASDHQKYSFKLDDHHVFFKGKVALVCGNSWRMLHETRFKKHFDFIGNFDQHFGLFEGCGKGIPFESAKEGHKSASCC
jgi:arsenite methyltransferase